MLCAAVQCHMPDTYFERHGNINACAIHAAEKWLNCKNSNPRHQPVWLKRCLQRKSTDGGKRLAPKQKRGQIFLDSLICIRIQWKTNFHCYTRLLMPLFQIILVDVCALASLSTHNISSHRRKKGDYWFKKRIVLLHRPRSLGRVKSSSFFTNMNLLLQDSKIICHHFFFFF